MARTMLRVIFALVVSLSLAFGVFAGAGVSQAFAADQPSGYNPVASTPPDVGYCYPSGYNRQGWRCGWRLAQAPYNLGSYYNGYYYGTGGPYGTGDYGGLPRYCYYYYNGVCYR